jgi:topoisomerase-4 subunit B
VVVGKEMHIKDILEFYMGKNTPDRQEFIISNLKVEKDDIDFVRTENTEEEAA